MLEHPHQSLASDNTNLLQQWDIHHIWHPFTPMWEYAREATPVIAAANGFELIDTDGRRYLDGTAALWCNLYGYRVPELDAALKSQIDLVSHSTLLGLSNVPAIQLAKALVDRAPAGLNHVFYSDDGSTAVEAALKIVYQGWRLRGADVSRKRLFVGLSGAYHGDTIGAVSVGGIGGFHAAFESLLFPCLRVPSPGALHHPEGVTPERFQQWCRTELEQVLTTRRDEIAGVVMEPLVQGAAGMLLHPPGYLKWVRQLTAGLEIPLIADEVFVGFGRTGTLWACEQEQVIPDLLCLSKGLTAGYLPLAATLVNDAWYQPFIDRPELDRTFQHGHTFTGNPLGCAVALESLRLFDERRILENVAALGNVFQKYADRHIGEQNFGRIRTRGAILAIDLVSNERNQAPFPPAQRIGHQIALEARERGLIIRPIGDTILLIPAPGMPPHLVEQLCQIMDEAIRAVLPQV